MADQNNQNQPDNSQQQGNQTETAPASNPTSDLGSNNQATTSTPPSQVSGAETTQSPVGNATASVNPQVATDIKTDQYQPSVAGTTPGDQLGGVANGADQSSTSTEPSDDTAK